MISSSCDLKVFVDEVRDKDYPDIIFLAELEAVEAWRLAQRQSRKGLPDHRESMRYSESLKELIFFLRNGVKPREPRGEDFKLFQMLCEDLLGRRHRSRCCDSQ